MNDTTAITTLVDDDKIIAVLRGSLYPGATPESAAMVLGYCRAAGLDPLLKPVHIVPMYAATGEMKNGKAVKAMRDVIMPGIGMYRIQAARTGQYAGQDEPTFGPMVPMSFKVKRTEWRNGNAIESWVDKTIEYPEWCSVTIYRVVGGMRCAFTAVEYWLENYATAARDSDAPNEMWARRTRGQLVKCAEAQALRKAFPEVGQHPTADEMEGRIQYPDADELPTVGNPEQREPVRPRRASEAAQDTPAALPPPAPPVVLEPPVPTAAEAAPVVAQQAAPEPVQQAPSAAPSGSSSTADSPAASDGERMNVIVTARAKKADLAALLAQQGLALDPATLIGLTKAQFKALKGAM